MDNGIIVMRGLGQFDLATLQNVAGDFGWTVHLTQNLRETVEVVARVSIVAVLTNREAVGAEFSWLEIIRLLRRNLPGVRLVICHGFGDVFDWTELCDAGAFHALQLPLKEHELRQSLGFIWEAERRLVTTRPVRSTAAA